MSERLTARELQSLRNAGNDSERAANEIERLRALLRRVLSCGLNEEPHGVGFTPSAQEKKAAALTRDIELALGPDRSLLNPRAAWPFPEAKERS